jgi:predicted deacylase
LANRVEIEAFHPHALEFFSFGERGAGPHLLITAGMHGGEATGIWVARQLVHYLNGKPVKGSIAILPVANPAAFRKLTRRSPYDELDLNRLFPGSADGTPSMVVANTIWAEARRADYIVDLHCCGIFGSNYTLALWKEYDLAQGLAAMIDIPVVIQSSGAGSQLFVEASRVGIPAVILELAGGQFGSSGGLLDREAGEAAFTALKNLLIRLGLLPGEAPAFKPAFYGQLRDVRSLRTALWEPAFRPGSLVSKGQVLGQLDGEPLLCPITGVATSVRPVGYVFAGYTLSMVAPSNP